MNRKFIYESPSLCVTEVRVESGIAATGGIDPGFGGKGSPGGGIETNPENNYEGL